MVFEHISRLDQLIPKSLLLSFEEDEESLDGKEAATVRLLDKLLIRLVLFINEVTDSGPV